MRKLAALAPFLACLAWTSAVFAQATCLANNSDAFTPFDVANGSTVYTTQGGTNTGWYPSLYGPDQSPGSNSETGVTGGTAHLTDGQNLAAGTNVTGGPQGITPLCSNGLKPVANVCADGSTATVGVAIISMSIGHRYYNSSQTQANAAAINTFLGQRFKYSFMDFLNTPANRVDFNGAAADTTYSINSQISFADCGQEGHNLADTQAANNSWAGNTNWNDSVTPSSWWSCANVRVPNYSVQGNLTQALTLNQIQVVEIMLTIGLTNTGSSSYQTLLPMNSLNGADCTSANIDGGAGPIIFACDIAYYLPIVIRNLSAGFPNIKMAFLDSMYYEGYTTNITQAPPCDYEQSFGVKKVIQAQISQTANSGTVQDTLVGNLCYKTPCPTGSTVAPYIDWGPYTWAQGTGVANNAGVTWSQGTGSGICGNRTVADYNTVDGCLHESTTGTSSGQKSTAPNGESKWARLGWLYWKGNATNTGSSTPSSGGTGLTAFFAPASQPSTTGSLFLHR